MSSGWAAIAICSLLSLSGLGARDASAGQPAELSGESTAAAVPSATADTLQSDSSPQHRSAARRRAGVQRPAAARHAASVTRLSPNTAINLDRSGRARFGKASFYAKMFAGRAMADGTPMRPAGNNAASLTLPLGTTAQVTNLETGKTAVVVIRDRGPYVAGRIVDLSPATARQIGLDQRTGVTQVEVAPISVPMPGGEIKPGAAVLEASNRAIAGAPMETGNP